MTSSFRGTGQASVRATPAASVQTAGAWSPAELVVPVDHLSAAPVPPAVTAALLAAESARLVDEGYARGLADGEGRGFAAAQAQVSETIAVLNQVTARMHEVAGLAP